MESEVFDLSSDPAKWKVYVIGPGPHYMSEHQRRACAAYKQHFPNDCDAIRKKILQWVAIKGHSQKKFIEAIGGSSASSLQHFLQRKGAREGQHSDVYALARAFFDQEEKKNNSPLSSSSPSQKENEASSSSLGNVAITAEEKEERKKKRKLAEEAKEEKKKSKEAALLEIAAFKEFLRVQEERDDEEEEDNNVEMKMKRDLNCNGVRKKINEFIATSGWTQTQLIEEGLRVNSASFGKFMSYTKPYQGDQNQTFYRGKRFFNDWAKFKSVEKKNAKKKQKLMTSTNSVAEEE